FLSHAIVPLDVLFYSIIVIAIASILGALLSIKIAKPSWLRFLLSLILLVSAIKILVGLF
ncbi:MAG: hypothetical protein QW616_02250, partial [Thermoplasmata archaeon]